MPRQIFEALEASRFEETHENNYCCMNIMTLNTI
jgi:hypothetical protein